LGLNYGEPLPWAYWRVIFAERFGWSFEYSDALPMGEVHNTIQVLNKYDSARMKPRGGKK